MLLVEGSAVVRTVGILATGLPYNGIEFAILDYAGNKHTALDGTDVCFPEATAVALASEFLTLDRGGPG